MTRAKSKITEIYCPKCDIRYGIKELLNLCSCGSPLLVDYDYDAVSVSLPREELKNRIKSLWRYRELLPVIDDNKIVTLDEGMTPLLLSKQIGPEIGVDNLFFKDETVNPTGSFKARGLTMAVSRAYELGLDKLIIPTAGNAGSALSAYAARAGIEAKIIVPGDSNHAFVTDCEAFGATVERVEGNIADCGQRVAELVEAEGWFSVATLKEPYRIEGKKTMGFELAEQFNYELPDVIIYPTGGGTGLIGMWKAFDEMELLGWIGSHRPKMVSVQSEGCAPIVRAFEQGAACATKWENASTAALGLRVPSAIGDFLILNAIRSSKGTAVAVSENDILKCTRELARREGVFSSPEGGATLAALRKLLKSGFISASERIVIFITGSGYKYLRIC